MNISLIELFYKVSQYKSFSEASEKLFISQPAISSQISKLEKELGVNLFNRHNKGISLTKEAKKFLSYVSDGIKDINNGLLYIKNLQNIAVGTLKIGTSATICKNILMPYLMQFHKKYPKIEIEIISGQNDKLVEQFYNGDIDVLCLSWKKFDEQLNVYDICEIDDVFICDEQTYSKTKQGVPISYLQDAPLIVQKYPSSTRQCMDKFLDKFNIKPNIVMESVSFDLIPSLVKSGFGIGFTTKQFIKELFDKKSVYILNINEPMEKRTINLITKKTAIPNICVEALIKIVKDK